MMLVLPIMACSLIGSVLLIGICGANPAVNIPTLPLDDPPPIVREEPLRDEDNDSTEKEDTMFSESIGSDSTRSDFRGWIVRKSIAILRAQGKTDEEVKAELLRDFDITEEQVDEMMGAR